MNSHSPFLSPFLFPLYSNMPPSVLLQKEFSLPLLAQKLMPHHTTYTSILSMQKKQSKMHESNIEAHMIDDLFDIEEKDTMEPQGVDEVHDGENEGKKDKKESSFMSSFGFGRNKRKKGKEEDKQEGFQKGRSKPSKKKKGLLGRITSKKREETPFSLLSFLQSCGCEEYLATFQQQGYVDQVCMVFICYG